MRSETITLAGQDYTVAELPMRANAAWRGQVEQALNQAQGLLAEGMRLDLKPEQTRDILSLVRRAGDLLLKAPDLVTDLVFAYAPALAADKTRILDEGYESELWEAFMACLRLAYPFGRALKLAELISANGSAPKPVGMTLTS